MITPEIRRLSALQHSASTARVLNLVASNLLTSAAERGSNQRFFQNRVLNNSLVIKHRIRPHELDLFREPRRVATKIVIPIDPQDLRLGGSFFFLGQRDFDVIAKSEFGGALMPGQRDRLLLELLDSLPSLDPFLLRGQLQRHGLDPAKVYFNISDGDIERMYEFVRNEITSLVGISLGGGIGQGIKAGRLVDKILSNNPGEDLGPLKDVLRMSETEYSDGIFAWRGFLYYKWVLKELKPDAISAWKGIALLETMGLGDREAEQQIRKSKARIRELIHGVLTATSQALDVYDDAYRDLTEREDPAGFRDFLLAAPDMFARIGEELGALQHVVSFWKYRFGTKRPKRPSAAELSDILADFEESLSCGPET